MNLHVPQHSMLVMDQSGHKTVTWNPDDPASVDDARREFDRLRGERYSAFLMDVDHENGAVVESKGRRIDKFDPAAGKLMMVPQLGGG